MHKQVRYGIAIPITCWATGKPLSPKICPRTYTERKDAEWMLQYKKLVGGRTPRSFAAYVIEIKS